METQSPQFSTNAKIEKLVQKIETLFQRENFELCTLSAAQKRKLKAQSIFASLSLEGSSLTEVELRRMIGGQSLLAPARELQKAQNELDAYELFPSLNAVSEVDLLNLHACLMKGLSVSVGCFRTTSFALSSPATLRAFPAERVPYYVADLLMWLQGSDAHPLIRAAVFHYEFECIHPFAEGNGLLGRLWLQLLLMNWQPIFALLPLTEFMWHHKSKYYEAMQRSSQVSDAAPLIEWLLEAILDCLSDYPQRVKKLQPLKPAALLLFISRKPGSGRAAIAKRFAPHSERTIDRILAQLKDDGKICYQGARKKGGYHVL